MVVYRVPSAYLTDYALVGQHAQTLAKYKLQDHDYQHQLDAAKLLSIQEANRILRNFNYMKDTEFLNQYAFAESIKEQRLIQRAGSVGLYIDRYI